MWRNLLSTQVFGAHSIAPETENQNICKKILASIFWRPVSRRGIVIQNKNQQKIRVVSILPGTPRVTTIVALCKSKISPKRPKRQGNNTKSIKKTSLRSLFSSHLVDISLDKIRAEKENQKTLAIRKPWPLFRVATRISPPDFKQRPKPKRILRWKSMPTTEEKFCAHNKFSAFSGQKKQSQSRQHLYKLVPSSA